jgi:phosphoribosylanthranilate isomerase
VTPRVKICGITVREDAVAAAAHGAAAVGLVFWPKSPRVVSPDAARGICRTVPAFVTRVGVFVNLPPDEVKSIVSFVGLDAIQLHGDERVSEYLGLGVRVIRAVAGGRDAFVSAAECPPEVTVLVDASDPDRRGGTGRLADWSVAAALARQRPIVLAGGLAPGNVADAIRQVRPWALDVSSGVERAPGLKDVARLADFFAQVRAAAEQRVDQ